MLRKFRIKIKLKINIFYKFKKGPWGGGNQFLYNLKQKFKKKKIYTDHKRADIILFNSHHSFNEILDLKFKYQDKKTFVHRIDGPISNYRKKGFKLDKLIFIINKYLADATILQSNYSLKKTFELVKLNNKFKVIYNQANIKYFYPQTKKKKLGKKIKLVSVSWSPNMLKGFNYLSYIDQNLDFSKFEMSFIGNTPIKFKNIKIFKSMSPKKLAKKIKDNDIFIFTSKIEACSNTLLEGMSCGLPVVVINSSSNPEIFNGRGELFNNKKDLIPKILKIKNNYGSYLKRKTMSKKFADDEYISFFKNKFKSKKLSYIDYIYLKILFINFKIFNF